MNKSIVSAAILAASIVIFGVLVYCSMNSFANKDRKVTVKGLSEMEVEANLASWPIETTETGDNMSLVYQNSARTNQKIVDFLKANGVTDNEIIYGTPEVTDMLANRYGSERVPYNYRLRSVLTVKSTDVDKVRSLIARQGELLEQGIAITSSYSNQISFDYTSFTDIKPVMMEEAIANARKTADQFASTSGSRLGKILNASQGQFTMSSLDENTPHIIKLRVITTITYSLE